MQNKGFISTIAVLLILICGFYISFSFVTSHYEKKAEEYAAKIAGTTDATNDVYKQSGTPDGNRSRPRPQGRNERRA